MDFISPTLPLHRGGIELLLFEQDHLPAVYTLKGGQLGEVDAAARRLSILSQPVPGSDVRAGLQGTFEDPGDPPAGQIDNL